MECWPAVAWRDACLLPPPVRREMAACINSLFLCTVNRRNPVPPLPLRSCSTCGAATAGSCPWARARCPLWATWPACTPPPHWSRTPSYWAVQPRRQAGAGVVVWVCRLHTADQPRSCVCCSAPSRLRHMLVEPRQLVAAGQVVCPAVIIHLVVHALCGAGAAQRHPGLAVRPDGAAAAHEWRHAAGGVSS